MGFLNPIFEPTLKLFFSADIIDSTKLKYTTNRGEWVRIFIDSFNDLKLQYTSMLKKESLDEQFHVWKSLGDEIIFVEHIGDTQKIQTYVECFKGAIDKFNSSKKTSSKLKATAWLAETPVNNAVMPDTTNANTIPRQVDVIGPSMDIGFRISKFASDRKFVVSVEIARILSEMKCRDLHIYFDGEEELKGVLKGIAYPIIWVDMLNGHPTTVEKLLNTERKDNQETLKIYLDEYIDEKKYLRFSCLGCLDIFNGDEYKKDHKEALSDYGIEPDDNLQSCETEECASKEEQVMELVGQLKL